MNHKQETKETDANNVNFEELSSEIISSLEPKIKFTGPGMWIKLIESLKEISVKN